MGIIFVVRAPVCRGSKKQIYSLMLMGFFLRANKSCHIAYRTDVMKVMSVLSALLFRLAGRFCL